MADQSGFDPVPWFVGGGAEHQAEIFRTVLHIAVGGGEGVVAPTDCKVTARDPSTNQVRIAPGAVVATNRETGARSESYGGRAPLESLIDIPPASGSGARTDLIVARVEDPQYGEWPSPPSAEAAADWPYIVPRRIPSVSAATLEAARRGKLNLGYPATPLAAVKMPAGAVRVENEYVEDLRRLARPRTHNERRMSQPTPEVVMDNLLGTTWPDYAPTIEVPAWATGAYVIATLSSIGQRGGPAQGYLTVLLGNKRADNIVYDLDAPVTGGSRHTLVVGGGWSDIRTLAGAVQSLHLEARKLFPELSNGNLVTVEGTQVIYDVQFYETVL